jgi:hypothetical protein
MVRSLQYADNVSEAGSRLKSNRSPQVTSRRFRPNAQNMSNPQCRAEHGFLSVGQRIELPNARLVAKPLAADSIARPAFLLYAVVRYTSVRLEKA